MKDATRRGFLAASGAGVATVAVAPIAFASGSGQQEITSTTDDGRSSGTGPLVVLVHDAAKGQVTVMRGEREVVVHDPALVRAITKHARDLGTEATR